MSGTRTSRLLLLLWSVAPALVVRGAFAAEPAAHSSTPAERQARGEEAARAFMLGRYEDALATYLDLYIQSDGRPEYLRNIGRCQQKLRQYPRAIESFKDYLRRGKKLSADERKEVQGFISEMETALANEGGGPAPAGAAPIKPAPPATRSPPAAAPPAIVTAPPAPVASPPTGAPAAPLAPAPNGGYVTGQATGARPMYPSPSPSSAPGSPAPYYGASPGSNPYGPPPPPGYQTGPQGSTLGMAGPPPNGPPALAPQYPPPAQADLVSRTPETGTPAATTSSPLKTIGIVSLVAAGAAAVGGTISLVRSRSIFDDATKAGCPNSAPRSVCDPKASSVDTANTVSKILYIGAGLLGAGGITMIVAAPSPTPDGRVSLAVSGRF